MILNISFLRRVGLCCKCLRSEYIFLKKSAFIRTGCKLIKHCMRYNWHSLDVSGMIYKQNKKYFTSKEFKNLAGCLRWWFLFLSNFEVHLHWSSPSWRAIACSWYVITTSTILTITGFCTVLTIASIWAFYIALFSCKRLIIQNY